MVTFDQTKPIIVKTSDGTATSAEVRYQMQTAAIGKVELRILFGALTQQNVDAIVCPERHNFQFTGNRVQTAIATEAGISTFYEAEMEARRLIRTGGELPLGYAIATRPGRLTDLEGIIHAYNTIRVTDPVNQPDCSIAGVKLSVISVLKVADQKEFRSVAFPNEGAGTWAFKIDDLLKGTILGMKKYFEDKKLTHIEKIAVVISHTRAPVETATFIQKQLQEVLTEAPVSQSP